MPNKTPNKNATHNQLDIDDLKPKACPIISQPATLCLCLKSSCQWYIEDIHCCLIQAAFDMFLREDDDDDHND